MTIQQTLLTYFKARPQAYIPQPSTTRYRVFMLNPLGRLWPGKKLFVGKCGALRVGRTVADSRPANSFKTVILRATEAQRKELCVPPSDEEI